jgi:hypothetical protein
VARLTFVSGGLVILLYGICIPLFGTTGAALAAVLREVLMLTLWLRPFNASFRRPALAADLSRLVLALAVMALPLVLLALHGDHLVTVIAVVLAFAAYAAAALALRLVDVGPLTLLRALGFKK